MSKFFIFFILIGFVNSLAGITWTSKYDEKNCNVFVQVNEDNQFLFAENLHIPGFYTRTACWDSWVETCHVNKNDTAYTNGMKRLGVTTFTNKSDQICYFENLGLNTGNMGGFYVQELDYVNGVNIKVSCENASSMSQYCAKSEKMARQVLFAKEELKCGAQGGKFTGGVYPQKMANDSTEYCISVSCDVCDSQWYLDLIEEWKEDVCCEQRGMEPNTNNGSCERPRAMDSTKIGATHSKITAFPGCSKIKAGGKDDGNFCKLPESSFSTEESSSSSDEAVSSSIESESSSSSEINTSSSSEEQEEVECYTDDASAETKLGQKVEECEVGYGDPHYEIDFYGCVVGSCDEYSSSSSAEDEGPGDDWLSSSSEEDGQCRDPSLMKERSNDLGDEWIYVGKEKYSSKIVSYEETKPAKSGFFDALGRMYKKVKSKIRYFVGKETKVKKTVEVAEELDVWKKVEMVDGREVVSYKKKSMDNKIQIDSILLDDERYTLRETNVKNRYVKTSDSLGVESVAMYDSLLNLKLYFTIGNVQDYVNHFDGSLGNIILRTNGDSVFWNVLWLNSIDVEEENNVENVSYVLTKRIAKSKYGVVSCPNFGDQEATYSTKCWRYPEGQARARKLSLARNNKYEPYFPGQNGSRTYGYSESGFEFVKTTVGGSYYNGVFCEERCGGYIIKYPEIGAKKTTIDVYASNWAHNKKNDTWTEECWSDYDMKRTYYHEKQHLKNSENAIKLFYQEEVLEPADGAVYASPQECKDAEYGFISNFETKFYNWRIVEYKHENPAKKDEKGKILVEASPVSTENEEKREPIPCE